MLFILTVTACGLLPTQGVLAAEPAPVATPAAPAAPAAPATPVTSAPVAAAKWPASQESLETMLPGDALGASTPIENELAGSVDTEWVLTKPVTIGGAVCTKTLLVTFQGFTCTLGSAYSSSNPRLDLRAGSLVSFGYGVERLSHFQVAAVEPPTKRVVVEGVPCTDYVSLGDDGHFQGCVLAEDRAFGTLIIPAGSDVQKNGQLQVTAGRAFEAAGKSIPAGALFTAALDGTEILVFEDCGD
jgi:hypothetical protein